MTVSMFRACREYIIDGHGAIHSGVPWWHAQFDGG